MVNFLLKDQVGIKGFWGKFNVSLLRVPWLVFKTKEYLDDVNQDCCTRWCTNTCWPSGLQSLIRQMAFLKSLEFEMLCTLPGNDEVSFWEAKNHQIDTRSFYELLKNPWFLTHFWRTLIRHQRKQNFTSHQPWQDRWDAITSTLTDMGLDSRPFFEASITSDTMGGASKTNG